LKALVVSLRPMPKTVPDEEIRHPVDHILDPRIVDDAAATDESASKDAVVPFLE